MAQYECSVCGYVYDASKEGTNWDDLPDDWECPVCGAAKSEFESTGGAPPQAKDVSEEGNKPSEAERPEGDLVQEAPVSVSPLGRAILAHRVFGYVFLAIYVVLIIQMVPRLWTYQIEFPARTVVHISLGMAIGTALILKITVVRFFRRLEQTLVPSLGTSVLVGSVVLIGISVPSAFREALATGTLFDKANQKRVRTLLAQIGSNELGEEECMRLSSTDSLRAGQRILRQECIDCHDLRTVLAKPRTPENWRQTVRRMADRTTALNPIEEGEQWQVTAYLIALSPQLQKSTRQLRDAQERHDQSQKAAMAVGAEETETAAYNPAAAKQLFESKCSQCHANTLVSESPPRSEEKARQLVASMVEEGLEATRDELAQIVRYLTETHANPPE
ncbi:MAG: rubredoxin [Planctomycetes bacterium]|nr:rubredoxin [Planctomycetota bacterium]MBL7043448.1 rubredoxin [Pirellulaceae bacterium]